MRIARFSAPTQGNNCEDQEGQVLPIETARAVNSSVYRNSSMGGMNGDAHAPSTPARSTSTSVTGSGTASEPRRPSTLKKRRPSSDVSIAGAGVNTSGGAGPSPLRRELHKVQDKKNAQEYFNPRSLHIQKLLVKWEVPRKVGNHPVLAVTTLLIVLICSRPQALHSSIGACLFQEH